ncbi:AraC family transcriptional regulator [Aquirufa sp. ROCK2-A2]|jgi:AraC-like DNA-binding protein
MKLNLEQIQRDENSSFRILLTPKLNEVFYWHFHPEIELVYVEAEKGIRHIGDHISTYYGSDLALIGPHIPHLNFDFGVKTVAETVVIQFPEHYFEKGLSAIPELNRVLDLMERAKSGLAFFGETKRMAGERLKKMQSLDRFYQFMELMSIFQFLADSDEYVELNVRPIAHQSVLKQQERTHRIYQFVEKNFQNPIDIQSISDEVSLSVPAFCRYFKKSTHLTYTDFVNQYRVNYAKKLLLQHKTVTETCFTSGFESLSYFNRVFKKWTGEVPSRYEVSIKI